MTAITDMTIDEAASLYLDRKDRAAHPDGTFDSKRRWAESDAEHRPCCSTIRTPSAAYPYSKLVHCRTLQHVANLTGVDEAELRKAARAARPPAPRAKSEPVEMYKLVAVKDGKYLSIYDGTTEYVIGTTLVQRVRKDHGGGYYAHPTVEGARNTLFPSNRALMDYGETAVLRVRCEGARLEYRCNCYECVNSVYCGLAPFHESKWAFTRITPLEVLP
jgi:hypothetical protein